MKFIKTHPSAQYNPVQALNTHLVLVYTTTTTWCCNSLRSSNIFTLPASHCTENVNFICSLRTDTLNTLITLNYIVLYLKTFLIQPFVQFIEFVNLHRFLTYESTNYFFKGFRGGHVVHPYTKRTSRDLIVNLNNMQ